MSKEEINELRSLICFGLRKAEENMLREKALHNDTIVTKYLYRKLYN